MKIKLSVEVDSKTVAVKEKTSVDGKPIGAKPVTEADKWEVIVGDGDKIPNAHDVTERREAGIQQVGRLGGKPFETEPDRYVVHTHFVGEGAMRVLAKLGWVK